MTKKILSLSVVLLIVIPASKAISGDSFVSIIKALSYGLSSVVSSESPQTDTNVFRGSEEKKPRTASSGFSTSDISAVQSYFPMCNGDSKNYNFSYLGTLYYATHTYTQVQYQGRTCFREGDTTDGSYVYYGLPGAGSELLMYGATLDGENYSFNSPLTVLNNSLLNNGGSDTFYTTVTVDDYDISVEATITVNKIGAVTIPLGTVEDCVSIGVGVSITLPDGNIEEVLEYVWTLAPEIGKLEIAAVDESSGNRLGLFTITGGTVCGRDVAAIIAPPPIASFTATPLEGPALLTVDFTDGSTGSINSRQWSFGDGFTSTQTNPTHTYMNPGIFSVSLTVSGPGGSDTETKPNFIRVAHAGADLDNDQDVNLTDAILALKIAAGISPSPPVPNTDGVTGKNRVGLEEAIYILQYVSGQR